MYKKSLIIKINNNHIKKLKKLFIIAFIISLIDKNRRINKIKYKKLHKIKFKKLFI